MLTPADIAPRKTQDPENVTNGRSPIDPLAPSRRSDVPPFMVMDVVAAAARIEAAGGRVIHMEVGQPGRRRHTPAREAAQAALTMALSATPRRWACRACGDGIARHYDEAMAADRPKPDCGDDGIVERLHPCVPCSV